MEDKARLGRLVVFVNDAHSAFVTGDELADRLYSSHGITQRHLKELGQVSKLGKCIPHKLALLINSCD